MRSRPRRSWPSGGVVVDDGSQAAGAVARVVERFLRARLIRAKGKVPQRLVTRVRAQQRARSSASRTTTVSPRPAGSEHLVSRLEAGADAVAGVTIGEGGPRQSPRSSWPMLRPLCRYRREDRARVRAVQQPRLHEGDLCATPFDESFPDAAGEDREWCARLIANGGRLCLEPKARLVHNQDLTLRRFCASRHGTVGARTVFAAGA